MPVADEDRHKTAFTSPFAIGLYQFCVMTFGLNRAPTTFQRLMNEVVRDMEKFAHAYLDDLLVFSDSWTEHLGHLETILEKLQEFGLTAKMAECQWAMAECTYLGHVVGGGYVKPEINKLEAVEKELSRAKKTAKEILSFLGLTSYHRHFIKEYAFIAAPLTNLTRNKCSEIVAWTTDCDKAFNALKNMLKSTLVLSSPDFDKTFILQTDASNYGIGAVLSQTDGEGLNYPVTYFSCKLLNREQKYSTVEKECIAIKHAVGI